METGRQGRQWWIYNLGRIRGATAPAANGVEPMVIEGREVVTR